MTATPRRTYELYEWHVTLRRWLPKSEGTASEIEEMVDSAYATAERFGLAGAAFYVTVADTDPPVLPPEELGVRVVTAPASAEPAAPPTRELTDTEQAVQLLQNLAAGMLGLISERDSLRAVLRDLASYFDAAERAVGNGGPTPPWDGMRFRTLRRRVAALVAEQEPREYSVAEQLANLAADTGPPPRDRMTVDPGPTAESLRDALIRVIDAAGTGETAHTREYGPVAIAPDSGDLADALLAAGYRRAPDPLPIEPTAGWPIRNQLGDPDGLHVGLPVGPWVDITDEIEPQDSAP